MGNLLHYAIVFLVVALVAAAVGFGGVAGFAMDAARLLFWVFIILFVISLVAGLVLAERNRIRRLRFPGLTNNADATRWVASVFICAGQAKTQERVFSCAAAGRLQPPSRFVNARRRKRLAGGCSDWQLRLHGEQSWLFQR